MQVWTELGQETAMEGVDTRTNAAHMKTVEARVTRNIKEEPSNEAFDVWNIEATFLDKIPEDATGIRADPAEIQVHQIEAVRTDGTRTAVTIRTQRKSGLQPGDVIHLSFE
jgi:hypothetical protein